MRPLRTLLGAAALASALVASPALAQTPAAAESLLERADAARIKGDTAAPVTIVEVSDFQCPYCRQWAERTWAQLDSAYVRTGKVRMIFVNYPIPSHGEAFAAAEAAMCAGAQGQFWAIHDRIFATQGEWSGQATAPAHFERLAQALRLDMAAFRACTASDAVAPLILTDVIGVSGAGIQGTPTFILNGRQVLQGAVSFEEMSAAIDAMLAAPAPPAQ